MSWVPCLKLDIWFLWAACLNPWMSPWKEEWMVQVVAVLNPLCHGKNARLHDGKPRHKDHWIWRQTSACAEEHFMCHSLFTWVELQTLKDATTLLHDYTAIIRSQFLDKQVIKNPPATDEPFEETPEYQEKLYGNKKILLLLSVTIRVFSNEGYLPVTDKPFQETPKYQEKICGDKRCCCSSPSTTAVRVNEEKPKEKSWSMSDKAIIVLTVPLKF